MCTHGIEVYSGSYGVYRCDVICYHVYVYFHICVLVDTEYSFEFSVSVLSCLVV